MRPGEGGAPRPLSVSQLASRLKGALQDGFDAVTVRGELSGFKPYSSGHWYFTLKDADAQLKGVMFARENRRVRSRPKDGDEVVVSARVDLYAPRGDLQLVCESMEALGAGRLQAEFERLKAKLQAEGLFDPARKRPLPKVPRRIGIVTSEQAAALQDILRILRQRDPTLAVTIAPCRVQGEGSAASIAAALDLLNAHSDVEIILCGRGGGSIEDLWAFNEETVARAIARSRIPVVSCVGHEIDFSIADFVADVRAPTPSAAAELAVPVREELELLVRERLARLRAAWTREAARRRQRVAELRGRLRSPRRALQEKAQRLDESRERLRRAVVLLLRQRRQRLEGSRRALLALGPLHTLERGWAIATEEPGGRLLRDAAAVAPGAKVRIRLQKGALRCSVDEALPGPGLDLRGRPA